MYLFLRYVSVRNVTSRRVELVGRSRAAGTGVRRGYIRPVHPARSIRESLEPGKLPVSLRFWLDPADEAGDTKKRTATLKRHRGHRRPSSTTELSTHPTVLSPGVSLVSTNFRQFGKISSCQNGASHQHRREVAEVAPRGREARRGLRLQRCRFFVPQFSARYFRGGPGSRRPEGRGSGGQAGVPAAARLQDARPPARPHLRVSALPHRRPPAALTCRSAPRREPGPRPTKPSVRASPALP